MAKRPFVAVMILLLSLSILVVLKINVAMAEDSVTISDVVLRTEFIKKYGPGGSTAAITDVSGTGVKFDFTNLVPIGGQGLGVCDDYAVSPLIGGDPDLAGGRANFARFTHYAMAFKNVGTGDVEVALFMNTGFTGLPGRDWHWDTFWKSTTTVTVPAGETRSVTLDFAAAEVWNAEDDPNPLWQYVGGTVHPVHRLDEVSAFGFEVYGNGAGSLLVSGYSPGPTKLYVNPALVQKEYADKDSVFEVSVKVDEITDFFGFDVKLSWDDTLLSLDHADYESTSTSPLKGIWGPTKDIDYRVQKVEAGSNYYRLVALSLKNGFTGSHSLLILGFKVLDPQTNSKKQASFHFETDFDKLSDSNAQSITHTTTDGAYEIWGAAPTLYMTHGGSYSRTCRKASNVLTGDEEFIVTISVSGAVNLAGLEFEIHYDTSMIDFVSGNIVWGSGTITHNEGSGTVNTVGIITGSGSPTTLVTITFKSDPNYKHVWKDPSLPPSGWQNDITNPAAIYFQSITLHYTGLSSLGYTRGGGGGGRLYVGPDFAYTFSPIRGDLNNDGDVDIQDLSGEASFFDRVDATMNLIGPPTAPIDIFDLVVVAGNFWYHYVPPPP